MKCYSNLEPILAYTLIISLKILVITRYLLVINNFQLNYANLAYYCNFNEILNNAVRITHFKIAYAPENKAPNQILQNQHCLSLK